MTPEPKELKTVKKTAEVTGASESFLWQLLGQGKLTKYKVESATFINILEFYSIAKRVTKPKTL